MENGQTVERGKVPARPLTVGSTFGIISSSLLAGNNSLMRSILLILTLIIGSTVPCRAAQNPWMRDMELKVAFVSGRVAWTNQSEGGVVSVGQMVKKNDVLITEDDGYVDIDYVDGGSRLRINPNTKLTLRNIDSISTGPDQIINFQLRLDDGSILCEIKKLDKSSKFEVFTRNGIMGIRGTAFYVNSDGVCRVLQGVVAAVYPGSNSPSSNVVSVSAGHSVSPPTSSGAGAAAGPTPKDIARSLERDFNDLKDHRLRRKK